MHEFIALTDSIISADQADISAVSSAALYGKGIFTTIGIYHGEPFLWEKHWRRLIDNAEKVGIDLSDYSEESTRKAFDEIIDKNNIADGRVRLTFFDERSSAIWPFEGDCKTSLLITTGDLRPFPEDFKLTISPYPVNSRSPLVGVKSCNYLENLLAFEEAKNRGFDEAIRLNEHGHITSGCMSNVFWLKDGGFYTPSLTTGCLAGTMREYVIENLECEEVEAGIEAIREADAIFLTSAGIGVAEIREFDGRQIEQTDHALLSLI